MPYLVDGNNLAHVLGLSQGGLADRDACSRIVAEFCRERGAQATIVFDGPAPAGGQGGRQGHRIRIQFSESRSADEVILKILGDSKAPSDFTVVTSDKSLGDKARHRGATVERAHEFSRRLAPRPKSSAPGSDKPRQSETPEAVDAWLAVFDPARKKAP